jgi:hypothetical protein
VVLVLAVSEVDHALDANVGAAREARPILARGDLLFDVGVPLTWRSQADLRHAR